MVQERGVRGERGAIKGTGGEAGAGAETEED